MALDNKAIKDQLATQQNVDVKPHDNSTTSPASKDPSVLVTDNHGAAAPDRSRKKLLEALTPGEFVHFTNLLRLEGDLHASEGQQVIITPQGQLLTKLAQPQRDISSFDSWLAAWFQFEKVMMEAHPNRYSELCAYREVIHAASRKFRWSSVYSYDVRFPHETRKWRDRPL